LKIIYLHKNLHEKSKGLFDSKGILMRGGEGRRGILIIYMFGSKEERGYEGF
jgi:hypothetical protein